MSAVRRVLFVGFAVSDEMFEHVLATDRGMPAQTQRFGWAVVDALREAGVESRLVSAEPVADFPNNQRVLVHGCAFTRDGTEGRSISFVNVTGFKHLTRYLAAFRQCRRLRDEDFDAVLVHGVHSPFLWAAVRVGALRGVPVVTIMTDPPSLRSQYDNRATLIMKRIDRQLIERALARMDGVIVLATPLATDFAPGVPSLQMEGIAPEPAGPHPIRSRDERLTVVYAGGIREEYGALDLAEAVEHSELPWRMVFYGRGPAVDVIERMAATDSRITYAGAVGADELPGVYRDADLLVNPRRLEGFTHYSFPSKLLEYMSSGTAVLTTHLPNLPEDYKSHLFVADPGAVQLAKSIDAALSLGRDELDEFGRRASEFIVRTRGPVPQGRRLAGFLAGMSD